MDMGYQFLLFVLSLVANAFSAFSGGGAGLIQLPALLFLGLPFPIALATHKVASVALGVGASLTHLRSGRFEGLLVWLMLVCGIPGVIVGALTILQIPSRWAEIALGLLTIGLGLYSYLNPSLGQESRRQNRQLYGVIVGGLGLFVIGFLNGSLTSGTGLFATLWLVRWFGVDYLTAVAHTLVLVGLSWNGTGALVLGMSGNIQWDWLPALLLGSVLGGYFGARLAVKSGNRWVKRIFELVTVLVGIKLLWAA